MIDLSTLLDLIDRFDVPALGVFTWLFIRGNRLANQKAMAEQQTAFVEALSAIKTEMAETRASLIHVTDSLAKHVEAFARHVEHDREDHKSLISEIHKIRSAMHA